MNQNELSHFGIKGMKWGVRRYQNKDGTLTKAGKKRYDKEMAKIKEEQKIVNNKKRTKAKLDKLEEAKKKLQDDKDELEGKKKENDDSQQTSKPNGGNQPVNVVNQGQVKKGKSFTEVVLTEMAAPAAKDVGKQLIKSGLTAAANEKIIKKFAEKYGLDAKSLLVYTNNQKK